jgi:hypothetical protein
MLEDFVILGWGGMMGKWKGVIMRKQISYMSFLVILG